MDKRFRKDLADGLRDAAKLADDSGKYGAAMTVGTVRSAANLARGIVALPAGVLRMAADAIEDNNDD